MQDITVTEAARILQVPASTVTRWVRRGILEADEIDGVLFLDHSDVLAAKDALRAGVNVGSNFKPVEIELRLMRLEAIVRDLASAAGMAVASGLTHLSDYALSKTYKDAEAAGKKKSWTDIEAKQWAGLFLKITEADLQRLAALVNEAHPWKPFLQLGYELKAQWSMEKTSLESADICYSLQRGIQNLRRSAMLYIALGDTSPQSEVDRFLQRAPIERLKRRFLHKCKSLK